MFHLSAPLVPTGIRLWIWLFCASSLLLVSVACERQSADVLGPQTEGIVDSSPRSCLPYTPWTSVGQWRDQDTQGVVDLDDLFAIIEIGGPSIRLATSLSATGVGASPDGQSLAFQMRCQDVARNAYHVGWYTLDLKGSDAEPVFIGEGGPPLLFRSRTGDRIRGGWSPTSPKWSPTGDWVAYLRSDGETTQVWRSRADGVLVEQVTQSEADVEAFFWSDEGNQIWYETDTPRTARDAFVDALWRDGAWAGSGMFVPRTSSFRMQPYQVSDGQPSLWVRDLETEAERAATEGESQAHFARRSVSVRQRFQRSERVTVNPERPGSRGYTLSPGSTYASWIESTDQGQAQIFVQDFTLNSTPTACRLEQCDGLFTERLFWKHDSSEILFGRLEGEDIKRNAIYAWNFHDDTIRRVHVEGDYHLTGCESTGRSLVCILLTANYPRTLVEVDINTGALTQIFDPNPRFESLASGHAELISWENEFGIRANGWLVMPEDFRPNRPYPLVIVQYNAQLCFSGGTGSEHPAQLYAANGMMVLCMSQPRGRSPDENGEGGDSYYVRQSVVSSWERIVADLTEQGLVDPDRVGITGFSAGGDNISYGLSRTHAFSAVISAWLPWSPMAYYLQHDGPITGRSRLRELGSGPLGTPDGRNFETMSLGLNADGVYAPILVQVSDDELIGSTFEYVTLQDDGVPIDMYVFRDEYHTKWWPQNRYAAIQRSLAWMRFWLQGEVDPDTMSDQQFEHWQGLCEQQIARLAASDDPVLQARSENQPCAALLNQ